MTIAQTLYVISFGVYLVFFVLFLRFFVWKLYSERRYWNRRPSLSTENVIALADELGKELPYISVLVPARNEALVIENTIRHMMGLEYPRDRYELIVVTDEKEILAARVERKTMLEELCLFLSGTLDSPPRSEKVTQAALAVLSEYSLKEFLSRGPRKKETAGVAELIALPASDRAELVRDVTLAIFNSRGRPGKRLVIRTISRACPWLSVLDRERIYPACLTVAMPAIAAYSELSGGRDNGTLRNAIQHSARASHELTRDIIARLTGAIARRVCQTLASCANTEEFRRRTEAVIEEMYPTTQEVVEKVMRDLESRGQFIPQIKHTVVPYDFDGMLRGKLTGAEVPSTKGRALNWGLSFLDPKSQVCGFYDAESRPHKKVLLYVGYRRLLDPKASKLLQGPVFQVRNFYRMTAFCRIASLYQAIAHDWYLPWLFRTLPFVGGTNVYVSRDLIEEIGGWDCKVLTEDLELGARAYLQCEAWPEYLPYSSSEQTPPNFKAFFRQRLRWGTGHLQVVDKVSADKTYDPVRRGRLRMSLIVKGQLEWIVYQLATFVPPTAMVLQYKRLIDPEIVPPAGRWMLTVFSLIYMSFTVYAFFRYKTYLDTSAQPETVTGKAAVYLGLLILPLAAFMFPVPYTTALVLKKLGREPRTWVKTPRTDEVRAS